MTTIGHLWEEPSGRMDSGAPGESSASLARLDSIYNPLTGFGGQNDKGAAGRPSPYVIPLSDSELRLAYLNSAMSRAIVDTLPDKATRKGWTVPDVPQKEFDRLKLWDRVNEGMKMGDLYGGAVMLLATEDDLPPSFRAQPDLWLREPLDLARVGQLSALPIFDAREAAPTRYDEDVRSVSFREPLMWDLATGRGTLHVHSSRVVWFRGRRRPPSDMRGGWGRSNIMPDDSVIQVVWDEVQRLGTIAQGGAILAQEIREAVVKIAGLAAKMGGDAAAEFRARLQLMQQTKSLLGITVIGEADMYENRSNSPAGWNELHEGALTMLCLALRWPRIMLTGQAPGGLSTDDKSGLERERQLVSDYQERHRAEISRIHEVLYASQDGPTSGVIPNEWALEFAPLNEPTAQETALLRDTIARTDATYISAGVYRASDVAVSRFGPEGYSTDMLEVEPIDEEEEARKALEQQQAMMTAMGNPEADPEADPESEDEPATDRADASDDSVCVLMPAPDPGTSLREAVERALGQRLRVPTEPPHITVLYVGKGIRPRFELAEVVATVTDEARQASTAPVAGGEIRTFPPGDDGVPVVIEFKQAYGLEDLNGRLLRRLAHRITARQHPMYRAHITIGYVPAMPSPEAMAALLAIDVSALRVAVGAVEVWSGGKRVASIAVG